MRTILRSYSGYLFAAILAVLFIFPAAVPQELRFLLGIICGPATVIFALIKLSGDEP
jgi:hypothetical protein